MKDNYSKTNDPSKGGDGGGRMKGGKGTNSGPNSGLQKKTDLRADVTKKPSDKNPYPYGLC